SGHIDFPTSGTRRRLGYLFHGRVVSTKDRPLLDPRCSTADDRPAATRRGTETTAGLVGELSRGSRRVVATQGNPAVDPSSAWPEGVGHRSGTLATVSQPTRAVGSDNSTSFHLTANSFKRWRARSSGGPWFVGRSPGRT